MADRPIRQPLSPARPDRQPSARMSWRRVLVTGAALFVATAAVMIVTGNPNLYPTVTLVGSFLVPMAFVAYLYDHQHLTTMTFEAIVTSFVLGGVLGVLGASILEPYLLPGFVGVNGTLGLSAGIVVGAIEEVSKVVAVSWNSRRMRHTGALDGLLLGAAAGMGFAALESSGYAFTVLLASGGDVPASLIETVLRAFLSPFGHGVWTAILTAAVFSASSARGYRITARVVLAFVFVTALHAVWDGLPWHIVALPFGVGVSGSMVAVSVIGLVALALVFRWSMRQQAGLEAAGALPPPAAE